MPSHPRSGFTTVHEVHDGTLPPPDAPPIPAARRTGPARGTVERPTGIHGDLSHADLVHRGDALPVDHAPADELRSSGEPRWSDVHPAEDDATPHELGKIVAHIPIHENDTPLSVLRRGLAALAGQIPIGQATRLRADALLRTTTPEGKAKEIAVGKVFDPSDINPEDRERFWHQGAITPVA